jgi:glycosyltransferase involved in cell wall biosynthesis
LKTSLIIFTRNELEGLKTIFPRIPFDIIDEVVAIDAHSTDGTLEYLQSKRIKVTLQRNLGRGNAMIEGATQTTGDYVIFLSSDGNENPADIPRLLEKLKDNDIAVASRFMNGGHSDDSDDPLLIRRLGNRFFTFLVNIIWRAGVTDSTNGLRAIRRDAWNRLAIDSPYHEAEFQMTIRAAKLGMKIGEIPTVEGSRIGGRRYASTTKMAWTFTKFLLREIWVGNRFLTQSTDWKRNIRGHYNRIAPIYERRKRDLYLRRIRESIGQPKGRRIADLGCGTGLALSWLDGDRVGVELSTELLRLAHKGPDYILADIETSPFRDDCFDMVLCIDVVEHLPSLRIVEEAHRILVKGGKFLLSTADKKYELILEILERLHLKLPEGPHTWREPKEILQRVSKAGFSCTKRSKAPVVFYECTKS